MVDKENRIPEGDLQLVAKLTNGVKYYLAMHKSRLMLCAIKPTKNPADARLQIIRCVSLDISVDQPED